MPTLLLVIGLVFAATTALSLWPPYRPGAVAVAVWPLVWLIGELPLHHIVMQATLAAVIAAAGGTDAPVGWLGLALTTLSIAGLLIHVRDALATARALALDHRIDRRFWELALIFPFRPRAVERVRNCIYHRDGRRQLCLDVFRAADPAKRRPDAPVFLWVHGGAWVIGNKGQQGRPMLHRLAQQGWVGVAIDYRLSPWATWPEHILDVKRALRWVREHIAEYGGDPRFVVIAGGSAGAHLASLAALTPNALEYQRDFPDVDTTVQACVAFYGVYDFVDEDRAFPHRAFQSLLLERIVMKRRFRDAREEFEKASPRWRLGPHAPPFMILHGTRDTLAPLAAARRFAAELKKVTGAPVVWAELPGAQHAFEVFPSLRSAAVIHGVEQFCESVYARWRATRDASSCQP